MHYCCQIINSRYPYFPAVDDNIALSHIAALLGSAGLKDAAQSLGRRLTISELPESTEPVQQIVKHQRLSSKITLDEGIFFHFGQKFGPKDIHFLMFFAWYILTSHHVSLEALESKGPPSQFGVETSKLD